MLGNIPDGRALSLAERKKRTVMVIEGHDGLRTLICGYLRKRGYTVLEASSGADARRLLCATSPVHLAIVEIALDSPGSLQLAWDLRTIAPGTKLLLTTTATEPKDCPLQGALTVPDAELLPIPYNFPSLGDCVRELLAAPPLRRTRCHWECSGCKLRLKSPRPERSAEQTSGVPLQT